MALVLSFSPAVIVAREDYGGRRSRRDASGTKAGCIGFGGLGVRVACGERRSQKSRQRRRRYSGWALLGFGWHVGDLFADGA